MNEKYEWREDKQQPSLATLYFQDNMLSTPIQTKQQSCRLNPQIKRRFKSQHKISNNYRISSRYRNINNSIIQQVNSRSFLPYCTIKQTSNTKDNNTTYKSKIAQKSPVKLKINNINKRFNYDINKSNSRNFIYVRESATYLKILSKKKQEATIKRQQTIRQNKAQSVARVKQEKEISGKMLNSKTPFIQFLIKHCQKQYRRRQQQRQITKLISRNYQQIYAKNITTQR